mgnify:CR=1 FL=1
MEQEITTIVVNYESDIKRADINRVNSLADALDKLDKTNVDDTKAVNLKKISDALSGFKSFRLGKGFGDGIDEIVKTVNKLETVKDITPFADNLVNGFNAVSRATEGFQSKSGAKIPINLGRGITGIVESINKIEQIRDISPVAETLNNSFSTIANAVSYFDGMDLSKLKNIDNIVNAFNNLGDIKPIDETIVKNAEMLAKAINMLDKSVGTSDTRLKALGSATRAVSRDFSNVAKSVGKFNRSLNVMKIAGTIWAIQKVARTMKGLISTVYGFVDAFGDVQNTLSFFNQSLDDQAPRIANIMQQYADAGVINFTEFSDQVSKLNQMYKGYGIAAEDAATMALSMTQLAYDASYALGQNGKDIELWNNRIMSMSTGQVRSGYYLGLDLSVQALSESFDGLSNNSDKATKVTAMYKEVMEQTVAIQGQMVREIDNTYVRANILSNRFLHLKQTIGRALIPVFESLIEVVMVALKVVELLFNAIASLWGGEFKLLNYEDMINDMANGVGGGMGAVADGADDIATGLGNANKQAKELKKTISGIDQVFTINDIVNEPSSGGAGGAGVGGVGGGIEGYDWLSDLAESANVEYLKNIQEQAEGIAAAIQKWFPWVVTAAAAFQAMKFSKKFIDNLKWIAGTKDIFGGLGLNKFTAGLGIGLLIDDILKFKDALDKLLAGDTSLMNLSKLVGSFSGILGDLMLISGNWKPAAVFIAIEGLAKVVGAISDMSKNGVNAENLAMALDGVGAVLTAFGLYQAIVNKNPKILGLGLFFTGLSNVIGQFDAIWKGIITGDWSEVDKVQLFTGAIMMVGGAMVAFGTFNGLLEGIGGKKEILEVPKTFETVDTSVTQTGSKMKDLAKNLGWVIVIAAEVVVIGLIFVGGIWLIGEMLQKVVEAWKPVIAEGETAAIAIGVGTALLVGVGLAAYAIGNVGSSVVSQIAIGGLMLTLVAAEALLFVGYVWAVGELLGKVITAWKPVLTDGDTAKKAILVATGLLVGIGVVTAALGVATVASAGLLPVAIGLGTAMLIALSEATKLFVVEIGSLADTMVNELHPPLVRLNEVLPTLSTNMENYVSYMKIFANHTVSLTKSTAVSGLSSTISTIIGWFTKDPIKSMADDVKKNGGQFETLVTNLQYANPLAKKGSSLMDTYSRLLKELKSSADRAANVGSMPKIGVDFKSFSKSVKDGFADLEKVKTNNVNNIMRALSSLDLGKFRGMGTDIVKAMELGINNYSFNLNQATNKIKNSLTVNMTSVGTTMARQVTDGINRSSASTTTFSNRLKSSMTVNMTSTGSTMAQQVVRGVNSASANVNTFVNSLKRNLNFYSNSIGFDIARGVTSGINGHYPYVTPFTNSLKNAMKRAFNIHSPSRWARDVIGAMIGEGTEDGINETKVNVNSFKRNIEDELYRFDIMPKVSMPTLDTRSFYQTLDKNAMNMNTNVQSRLDIDAQSTDKVIEAMNTNLSQKLDRVVDAVEQNKDIYMDSTKVTGIVTKEQRNEAVNNNTVLGGRR